MWVGARQARRSNGQLFSLSFIAGELALLPTADSSPLSTLTIAGLVHAEHVHSNGLPAKEALKAEFGSLFPNTCSMAPLRSSRASVSDGLALMTAFYTDLQLYPQ
jgi:hypothetical protein